MIKYRAVLFDFDGVLADTMQDNFLAWKKTFRTFGINIKEKDYFPLEGLQLREVAKSLFKKYQIDLNLEKIIKLKDKNYLENHSFSFYSEIPPLINQLKERGKLLAIVSAGTKNRIKKTVPEEFLNQFNFVVSGDDTLRGKPFPDPYLVAMNNLNVKPNECIVIENAPLGIKSAKSAGAYCIALKTTLNEEYLKEADIILNTHNDLKRVLLNIG